MIILLLLVVGGGVGTLLYYTKQVQAEVPELEDKLVVRASVPTVIYAADGTVLLEMVSEYRKPFEFDDVPPHVIDAFIAAEDRRFFEHQGVDYFGLARAVVVGAREGRATQGGSTITMQLTKLLVTGSERTADRKIRDIILANELENLKTKRQILELYLKTVYFGEGAYGLASAADVYFGKRIQDLTISEAAMLARCVRRPSDENPVENFDRALRNRNVVLDLMREDGLITDAEYADAKAEDPKIRETRLRMRITKNIAPYFVDAVLREIRSSFPEIDVKQGGYRIYTTIDLSLQAAAQKAVYRVADRYRGSGVTDACFVLVDRAGHIVTMISGRDYSRNQFDIVTQGQRQPGSSFKPLVYTAALESGTISPTSAISNAPISKPQGGGRFWRPKNSGRGQNASSYSLAYSIAASVNRPALWTYFNNGKETTVNYIVDRFGIRSPLTVQGSYPDSLALGSRAVRPIEMAEAYSVFQLGGDRVRPTAIKRIIAPDGTLIKEDRPVVFRRAVDPWVAETMDGFLRQVVTNGTGRAARVIPDARGKTGTTNNNRDAWFVGYTPEYVGVAWVGNTRPGQSMASSVFGGTVAIQFWVDIFKMANEMRTPKSGRDVEVRPAPPRPRSIPRPEDTTDARAPERGGEEDQMKAKAEPEVPTEVPPDDPSLITIPPAEPPSTEPPKSDPASGGGSQETPPNGVGKAKGGEGFR